MTDRNPDASPPPSSGTAPVRVLDQGREVDRIVGALLTMPDGRTGVLHWGLVFPLVEGAIDVAGPSALPAACRPLGEAHAVGPAPFELVEGAGEAVVLLDGSVVRRDEVAARLRAAGLPVLATGARLVAAPGEPAWFIRLRRPADDGPLRDRVSAALAAGPLPSAAPADRSAALEDALRRLRAEAAAERDAAERERAAQAARIAALERELAETRRHAVAAPAPVDPPPSAPARVQRRVQDEIATALAALAPSIDLLQDSLPVIVTELADRGPLYAALRELDAGGRGMPTGWKRLGDVGGWWERHLATGQSHAGRLYARHEPGRARWAVLVSTKARQGRDIAWLRGRGAA